jgi:hypothetical protein
MCYLVAKNDMRERAGRERLVEWSLPAMNWKDLLLACPWIQIQPLGHHAPISVSPIRQLSQSRMLDILLVER